MPARRLSRSSAGSWSPPQTNARGNMTRTVWFACDAQHKRRSRACNQPPWSGQALVNGDFQHRAAVTIITNGEASLAPNDGSASLSRLDRHLHSAAKAATTNAAYLSEKARLCARWNRSLSLACWPQPMVSPRNARSRMTFRRRCAHCRHGRQHRRCLVRSGIFIGAASIIPARRMIRPASRCRRETWTQ